MCVQIIVSAYDLIDDSLHLAAACCVGLTHYSVRHPTPSSTLRAAGPYMLSAKKVHSHPNISQPLDAHVGAHFITMRGDANF